MKKLLPITAMMLTLIACSKEVVDTGEIVLNISYPSTKANGSYFEKDDAISLYAVEYDGDNPMPLQIGGNFINNEKIIFNGSAWTGGRTLYWSDKACDFYAVYPYQESVTSINSFPFEIETDQREDGYEMSDIMYACAKKVSRTDGSVALEFNHILSKVNVNIIKGDSFQGEIPDDIIVHIYNTNVQCMVNLSTGQVDKKAFGSKKTITMSKQDNQHFSAVIIPQNIEKKTPLVEVTMGGIAYLFETSMSFRSGYVHNIDVTLNTSPDQEQIDISIDPSINGWN